MVNWREEITREMLVWGESWDNVVYCTLTEEQLDKVFDDGFYNVIFPETLFSEPLSICSDNISLSFPCSKSLLLT